MNRKTKRIFLIIISVLLVILFIVVGLNLLKDKNSLSVEEKKYLDTNSSKVFDVFVPNDISIFGDSGTGVFFDYIEYLKKDLDININNHNTKYESNIDSYGFYITKNYNDNDSLFYKDHFVVISSLTGLVNNFNPVGNTVGVIKNDTSYVANYYNIDEANFKSYDSFNQMTIDLGNGTIKYAIVALNEYKPTLIENGINIVYHISDLNKYYYFHYGDNKTLNSIYKKMSNKFIKNELDKSYNKNNYKLFIDKLGISDVEEDTLTNKVYKYGFVENLPYEILKGGEYGGITAQYLQLFQEFSGVEFTYQKYHSFDKLNAAVANNKIDLFYNYYTTETGFTDSGALSLINFYVYADNSIDLSMSNINGLQYKEVYVQENSYIYDYIKDIEGIKIKTFHTTSDLKKVLRKKSIIIVDKNTVTYYLTQLTNDYSVRFSGTVPEKYYSFKYTNSNDTLYQLFNAYTKTIDINDLVRKGITTYNKVYNGGTVLEYIAFIILIIIVTAVLSYLFYKKNKKKLKINTKVKKDDRIKYIDMLTSLKNRNYLNEQMPLWNKNKIYPQTCIVFDINKVKELNDSSGYEAGDRLIQEVANILVKNQIDNSEIMRTDGNEFMVYMVGYSEKQVMSYLKKITKSLSKLNYEPGVAVGYSTVEDSTKLVEDAFNEASIKMRENKEIEGVKDAKKISKTYKKVKSQLKEYFLNILDITKKPEMSILPGQLAFTILLSTVPIITFTGYLVSILNLNTNYIIDLLNHIIPGGSSYLITSLSAFKTQISFVDVLIFIWMFYIATNGCNTVIVVSNQIYGINSSTWLKRRLKAIFMTLYIILLIVFVVLSPIFIDSLFDLFDRIIIWNGIYGLINYLRKPFMFLLIYIFLRVFYNFAPDRVRENSHLKTGALFTTIGWFIVTSIYQHSASNMATYTAFYGALANVAIIMIWLYFVSYIFVIGLILNFGEESKEKDLEKTGAIKIIRDR